MISLQLKHYCTEEAEMLQECLEKALTAIPCKGICTVCPYRTVCRDLTSATDYLQDTLIDGEYRNRQKVYRSRKVHNRKRPE